ncbi:hypothetical protein BGZ65_010617, partial [Modicella reniformis]
MLSLLCLLLSGVVAVQTKPKQETFAPFLVSQRRITSSSTSSGVTSSSSGGRRGITGWFSRNILEPLGAGPRVPEHTITDYFFFHMAKLNDGSGLYLGIFQQWWVVSELQEVTDGTTRGGNEYEEQAEAKKREAVQAKIKKDYPTAAKRYVEAAKLFEKSGT